MYEITPEALRSILGYLNDKNSPKPEDESLKLWFNLSHALEARLIADFRDARAELATKRRALDRVQRRKERIVEEEEFSELGVDIFDICQALRYCLAEKHVSLSRMKIMYILYDVYAAWLSSHSQRICLDHPVMTQYGPIFGRAYKRLKGNPPDARKEDLDALKGRSPGLAVLVERAAAKYYDQDETVMRNWLLKSRPCRNAKPQLTGEKWGRELSDKDIYHWKKND